MQKLQPLCSKRHAEIGNAGDVATGPVKVCDEAGLHGVAGGAEHDRDRRRCALGCECRRHAEGRGDEGDSAANEVGCQFRQAIGVVMRPPEFDGQVLALDVAALAQSLAESSHSICERLRRAKLEQPDYRQRRLLRARRERPRGCAAEECNEVAPSHAIALEAKPTKGQRCASQQNCPTIGNGYSDPRLSGNRWLPQTTCAFFLFGLRRAHRSKETSSYRFVSPYWTAPRIELIGYWVIETSMETLVW